MDAPPPQSPPALFTRAHYSTTEPSSAGETTNSDNLVSATPQIEVPKHRTWETISLMYQSLA